MRLKNVSHSIVICVVVQCIILWCKRCSWAECPLELYSIDGYRLIQPKQNEVLRVNKSTYRFIWSCFFFWVRRISFSLSLVVLFIRLHRLNSSTTVTTKTRQKKIIMCEHNVINDLMPSRFRQTMKTKKKAQ